MSQEKYLTPKPSDHERGIYNKYRVERSDGNTDPNARYFVIRYDKGEAHALAALSAYAYSCKNEYPKLSEDIFKILEGLGY